jgi:hypothetical protein
MTPLARRVAEIDWDEVSRGQATGFEARFAQLASAQSSPDERLEAREWIAENIACYPIAGLAGRFLVELAADPATPDLAELLALLVTCAVGDHVPLLRVTEAARRAAFEGRLLRLTFKNRYEAIASGTPSLVGHLRHADAAVRTGTAFVLAWFAPWSTDRVVPAARAALEHEESPEARASLVLCLALHGAAEPVGARLHDRAPLVRLAAAIAETLLPADRTSDRAVTLLAEAVNVTADGPDEPATAVPWGYGDLHALAFARFCQLPERFAHTTFPILFSMLDAENGRAVVESLIAATFPTPHPPSSPLSPVQRDVLIALVTRPALWRGGTPQSLHASGVDLGRGRTDVAVREHLRKTLGLPRDPPTAGVRTSMAFRGTTQPIVHWWADFEDGAPLDGAELADAMAAVLTPGEAIELVGTARAPEVSPAPPATLVPPGGEQASTGKIVWKDTGYRAIRTRYRDVWEAAGWELLLEQTTSVSWKGTLHRHGHIVEGRIEHDWNEGDPRLDEVSFSATTWYALEPLFVRAAAKRTGFWDALLAAAERDTRDARIWPHVRMAILAAVGLGAPPPNAFDAVAQRLQTTWAYPQPVFQGYAMILPTPRREDLVIEALSGDEFVFELFGLAPTERVLAAIWPRVEEHFGELTRYRQGAFGLHEELELAALFGPVSGPRLLALAEGPKLSPELRQRAANLARLAGVH